MKQHQFSQKALQQIEFISLRRQELTATSPVHQKQRPVATLGQAHQILFSLLKDLDHELVAELVANAKHSVFNDRCLLQFNAIMSEYLPLLIKQLSATDPTLQIALEQFFIILSFIVDTTY